MSQEPIINGYLRQMLSMGGSDLHLTMSSLRNSWKN